MRAYRLPLRADKWRKRALSYTLHGVVDVRAKLGDGAAVSDESDSTAGLEAGGWHDWKDEWDGPTYIGPPNPPPTKAQIAARLRTLSAEMDDIAVAMDYYGGLSEWAQHGREIAGAGAIARQWADKIEASNDQAKGGRRLSRLSELFDDDYGETGA